MKNLRLTIFQFCCLCTENHVAGCYNIVLYIPHLRNLMLLSNRAGNQEKQLDVYNFCFIFDNTKLFDEVSTYCSGKYLAHVYLLLSSGQIK